MQQLVFWGTFLASFYSLACGIVSLEDKIKSLKPLSGHNIAKSMLVARSVEFLSNKNQKTNFHLVQSFLDTGKREKILLKCDSGEFSFTHLSMPVPMVLNPQKDPIVWQFQVLHDSAGVIVNNQSLINSGFKSTSSFLKFHNSNKSFYSDRNGRVILVQQKTMSNGSQNIAIVTYDKL